MCVPTYLHVLCCSHFISSCRRCDTHTCTHTHIHTHTNTHTHTSSCRLCASRPDKHLMPLCMCVCNLLVSSDYLSFLCAGGMPAAPISQAIQAQLPPSLCMCVHTSTSFLCAGGMPSLRHFKHSCLHPCVCAYQIYLIPLCRWYAISQAFSSTAASIPVCVRTKSTSFLCVGGVPAAPVPQPSQAQLPQRPAKPDAPTQPEGPSPAANPPNAGQPPVSSKETHR
jgi:hypothetical protein